MSRHVVRHIAVQEGDGFDLADGERVLSVDYDAPWFHLVLLLEDDGVDPPPAPLVADPKMLTAR